MKYFFIGDQGISMHGLKEYARLQGIEVAGSDLKTGGHKAENITDDIDLVIRSSAINPGSDGWAEVEEAERKGIPVIKRSNFLGQITKNKNLIAVSGMHGKTTVSTMAGLTLINAGFDPTVLIGERVKEFNNDVIRIGSSEYFVIEACEYDRSFLDFNPKILILTNIEEEHLDTYPGGLAEIKEAYIEYINHVPDNGTIIACLDDENIRDVLSKVSTKAQVIYYGKSSNEYNKLSFDLNLPGKHNVLNALAVVALADVLKINQDIVRETLQKFTGAKRRFELLGQYNGADLIDDYGHHPTEISSTIQALKEKYPDKHKVVVFWPHQYKRVLPLLDQFANAFIDADEVIIKPIFFVPGRDEVLNVKSEDIIERINKNNPGKARLLETDEEIAEELINKLDANSVVLTIGIPPIYKTIETILAKKGETGDRC